MQGREKNPEKLPMGRILSNYASSIQENVMMHDRRAGEEQQTEAALAQSGFLDRLKTLPEGLGTALTREFDEKGVQLLGARHRKLPLPGQILSGYKLIFGKGSSVKQPHTILKIIKKYFLTPAILSLHCSERGTDQ